MSRTPPGNENSNPFRKFAPMKILVVKVDYEDRIIKFEINSRVQNPFRE